MGYATNCSIGAEPLTAVVGRQLKIRTQYVA
jgi:hypothetical protein